MGWNLGESRPFMALRMFYGPLMKGYYGRSPILKPIYIYNCKVGPERRKVFLVPRDLRHVENDFKFIINNDNEKE